MEHDTSLMLFGSITPIFLLTKEIMNDNSLNIMHIELHL